MTEKEFIVKFSDDDDLDYEEFYYPDASGRDIDITIEAHE